MAWTVCPFGAVNCKVVPATAPGGTCTCIWRTADPTSIAGAPTGGQTEILAWKCFLPGLYSALRPFCLQGNRSGSRCPRSWQPTTIAYARTAQKTQKRGTATKIGQMVGGVMLYAPSMLILPSQIVFWPLDAFTVRHLHSAPSWASATKHAKDSCMRRDDSKERAESSSGTETPLDGARKSHAADVALSSLSSSRSSSRRRAGPLVGQQLYLQHWSAAGSWPGQHSPFAASHLCASGRMKDKNNPPITRQGIPSNQIFPLGSFVRRVWFISPTTFLNSCSVRYGWRRGSM
mmetsp:Transcript_8336/g.22328  ORF Transcript_8336/g.22328 Transcript_8336/m.22328 type:complete len:290 (+) Transcript_8336:296-1165(+)